MNNLAANYASSSDSSDEDEAVPLKTNATSLTGLLSKLPQPKTKSKSEALDIVVIKEASKKEKKEISSVEVTPKSSNKQVESSSSSVPNEIYTTNAIQGPQLPKKAAANDMYAARPTMGGPVPTRPASLPPHLASKSFEEQAMSIKIGRKRKRKEFDMAQIVDIDGSQLTSRGQVQMNSIPRGGKQASATAKMKSQIGALASQASINEAAIRAATNRNYKTKAQTRAQYGW